MKAEPDRTFLVYCTAMSNLRVFLRLRQGLAERGLSLVIMSNLLSVFLCASWRGIPCVLLQPTTDCIPHPGLSPEKTPEFIRRLICLSGARKFQNSVWTALETLRQKQLIQAIGLWNGLNLAGQTVAAFARAYGLPTVFFELGNINHNLFIDPDGVNAVSRIANHPELLDEFAVTDDAIALWQSEIFSGHRNRQPLPQARLARHINPWYPINWIGNFLLRVPQPERFSPLSRIVTKYRLLTSREPPTILPAQPYLFLVLQVSSDTNLLLFSDHDNLAVLEFAIRRAKERGCLLVVKPHPAETDALLLKKLAAVCAKHGYLLTSCDATRLVLGAEEVITINSTVGLTAMLLDKPVVILGRSLYGRFSRRQAYTFAMQYLVDFNPFGSEPASPEVIDRIISVIDISRGKAEISVAQP